MEQKTRVAVLGGDARQVAAAEWLARSGYAVAAWGLCESSEAVHECMTADTAVVDANILLLPIPLSRDRLQLNGTDLSLAALAGMISCGMTVFCGMPSEEFTQEVRRKGAEVIDYSIDEVFMIKNAMPTAEGAVAIAMNEMRRTLFGSEALVVGYGRIGKLLADLLVNMGARVTVSARKSADLATAELHGCHTLPMRCQTQGDTYRLPRPDRIFHVIFNTVPSPLLDEAFLQTLKQETVLIDLASAPGGIDYDCANRMGLKTVIALSLPGKVAPVTAGEIIGDCVVRHSKERGN